MKKIIDLLAILAFSFIIITLFLIFVENNTTSDNIEIQLQAVEIKNESSNNIVIKLPTKDINVLNETQHTEDNGCQIYSMSEYPQAKDLGIQVLKCGNGPIQKLAVFGMHASSEWNAGPQLWQALEKEIVIPKETTLWIIPNLNPTGEFRNNHREVDLNRNFPTGWTPGKDAGEYPASEIETKFLMDFAKEKGIKYALIYHSADENQYPNEPDVLGWFCAGVQYETEPGYENGSAGAIALANKMSQHSEYISETLEGNIPGDAKRWFPTVGIYAVNVEIHNRTSLDLENNISAFQAFLKFNYP